MFSSPAASRFNLARPPIGRDGVRTRHSTRLPSTIWRMNDEIPVASSKATAAIHSRASSSFAVPRAMKLDLPRVPRGFVPVHVVPHQANTTNPRAIRVRSIRRRLLRRRAFSAGFGTFSAFGSIQRASSLCEGALTPCPPRGCSFP